MTYNTSPRSVTSVAPPPVEFLSMGGTTYIHFDIGTFVLIYARAF